MKQAIGFPSVAVIGGGAWGTALANLCAMNGVETRLWAREPEVVEAIITKSENTLYLPGVPLHSRLMASHDLSDLKACDAILFVVPSQFSRPVLGAISGIFGDGMPIALCSKGIERSTGFLMTEVLGEVWPAARAAVLSGPSFARDVAIGLPTAVTLACAEKETGQRWLATLGASSFRPYLSDDLVGAEIGGAIKNVLAIAAGAVVGAGLGESARAAVIARGFAEARRLGVAIGAKEETLGGLSGLGDLILTATSAQSRNMSLGQALGAGQTIKEILAARNSVSEGVETASAIVAMASRLGVELPICTAVADLVTGKRALKEIFKDLMARPLKQETA